MRSGIIECMQVHDQLARMDAQQLREFAANLIETVVSKDRELQYKQLKIERLEAKVKNRCDDQEGSRT